MSRPAELFAIAATALLGFMFLSRLFASGQLLSLHLHGTYFASRPDFAFLLMATLLCLMATLYSLPLRINESAALWHFWLTVLSTAGFWGAFYLMGSQLSPGGQKISHLLAGTMYAWVLFMVVLILAQGIFAVNFAIALTKFVRTAW